jgi:hypothetical protein
MSNNWFDNPLIPDDLRTRIADRYATFAGTRMEAAGGGGDGGEGGSGDGSGSGGEGGDQGGKDQTFKQADVDRIVADRLKREREATKTKYADYEDLKKKAEGAKTAEERMAELEREIEATKREALKRRVQAAHGIADEDADLFLTGTDEETLTAQAKRLAERESERKKQGNRVPGEGRTPATKANDEREAVRSLFGTGG